MSGSLLVKVCGMCWFDNVQGLLSLHPDYMGMIFYSKSPRCVLNGDLSDRIDELNKRNTKFVGVFVNDTLENIVSYSEKFKLDCVQLHGSETVSFARDLKRISGLNIVKVFSVKDESDILSIDKEWKDVADYVLFDYKCEEYGGSGKKFDWSAIGSYKLNIPFLLSGGVGLDDCSDVLSIRDERLAGVDVNSKFEISPGIKDIGTVSVFISRIKG